MAARCVARLRLCFATELSKEIDVYDVRCFSLKCNSTERYIFMVWNIQSVLCMLLLLFGPGKSRKTVHSNICICMTRLRNKSSLQ